jgi:hypothetical protein
MQRDFDTQAFFSLKKIASSWHKTLLLPLNTALNRRIKTIEKERIRSVSLKTRSVLKTTLKRNNSYFKSRTKYKLYD